MEAEETNTKKGAKNLLKDDRFKAMFENPEFQVDKNADEYKMLAPVLTRLDKGKVKELKRKAQTAFSLANEEQDKSSDDDLFSEKEDEEEDDKEESSDDDARIWSKDVKKQYRQIRKETKRRERANDGADDNSEDESSQVSRRTVSEPTMVEVSTSEFKVKAVRVKTNK